MTSEHINTLRIRSARIGIIAAVVVIGFITGCQPTSTSRHPAPPSLAHYSPATLDPSLSDADLHRLDLPYGQIDWARFIHQDDCNDIDVSLLLTPPTLSQPYEDGLPVDTKAQARKDYLNARWLMKQNQHEQALGLLRQALTLDPNSAALWSLKEQALLSSDKNYLGSKACFQALELDRQSMIDYYYLGMHFWKRGMYHVSAAFLHQGLLCPAASLDNPLTGVMAMQSAIVLQQLNYANAAIHQYERTFQVLERLSSYSHADLDFQHLVRQLHVPLLAQAGLYLQLGEMDKAAQMLTRAEALFENRIDLTENFINYIVVQRISLAVRYAQLQAYCRYLLTQTDDRDSVIKRFYQAGLKLSQTERYLKDIARWHSAAKSLAPLTDREYAYGLTQAGQLEPALRILESLGDSASVDPLVLRDLADVYAQAGRLEDMLAVYDRHVSVQPDNADAIYARFQEHFHLFPSSGALVVERLDDPNHTDGFGLYYLLGRYARWNKQNALAQVYWERTIAQRDTFLPAYYALYELLLEEGRYEQLVELAEHSEPVATTSQLQRYLAQAHLQLDHLDNAYDLFTQLHRRDQDNPQGYLALAEIYLRRGEMQRAEQILLELLGRWPEEQATYQKLISLYCQWGVWTEDKVFAAAAEQRARDMLARWITLVSQHRQQQEISLADAAIEIMNALEALQRQRPHCRITAMLLTDFYHAMGRYQDALDTLEPVLLRFPEDQQVLRGVADLSRKLYLFDRAADYYYEIWLLNPASLSELHDALVALRRAGRIGQAWELLEENQASSETCGPERFSLLSAEIQRLTIVSQRYGVADAIFSQWFDCFMDDDVDDPDRQLSTAGQKRLVNIYAWSLVENQRYSDAFDMVTQYRSYFADDDYALIPYFIRSMSWRGQEDAALDYAHRLWSEDPCSPVLTASYVLALDADQQHEQAVTFVREQLGKLSDTDDDEMTYLYLSLLHRLRAYQAMEEYLYAQRDQGLLSDDYLPLLVEALIQGQEYREVEELLESSGNQDEPVVSPYLELLMKLDVARGDAGRALRRLAPLAGQLLEYRYSEIRIDVLSSAGQTEAALAELETLLEDREMNIDLRLRYSTLLDRAGRYEESLDILEALILERPMDSLLLNNLGYMMVQHGRDPERALAYLEQSLYLDPFSPPTLDSLGWYYYRQGDFDRALEYILKAAAGMSQDDYEVLNHLGDVYYRMGQREDARDVWQRALQTLDIRLRYGESYLAETRNAVAEKLSQLEQNLPVTISPLFDDAVGDNVSFPVDTSLSDNAAGNNNDVSDSAPTEGN